MSHFDRKFERNLKVALHSKVMDLERSIIRAKEEVDYLKENLQKFHYNPDKFQSTNNLQYVLATIFKETTIIKESIDRIHDAPFEDTLPLIRYTCFDDKNPSTDRTRKITSTKISS
jgi:hypothetical protein